MNLRQRMLTILLSFALSVALTGGFAHASTGGGTFGDFVGSNSFFDENQACYDILGNVREYHPWYLTEWTTGDHPDGNGVHNNSITSMNPQATFINSWGLFDNYYRIMREKGIEVTLVMQGSATGKYERPDHQDPDRANSTNSTVPASYLGHAQSMFQHAARYGSNKNIDPNLVRVAAGTEKHIGLGYLRYYENYNEPIWGGFNGAQFAAMLSADYDGHMGTLGPGVGIKAADPNAKVVFGGSWAGWFREVSNGRFTDPFLADMMAWFDANRTLEQWKAAHGGSEAGYVKYPFDVISAHSYSWDSNGNGISAEAYGTYGILKTFVDNCRTMFPGKELFFSEFGWDTSPNSTLRAWTPGHTTLETQGRWLVRDYLLAAAAGIDRARQFMMPDTSNDRENSGWHGTSGMIHGIQRSADFKPSWYYVGTMANVLKDASLASVVVLADGGWTASRVETNGPWALRFSSTKNSDRIFALWLPTSLGDQNGANTRNYTITVPAGYRYATLITMKDKVRWGEHSDISSRIQSGSLTVSISEKPVFVVLGEGPYTPPAGKGPGNPGGGSGGGGCNAVAGVLGALVLSIGLWAVSRNRKEKR